MISEEFVGDLRKLINNHSVENESDTPDHVLTLFLIGALESFELATKQRDVFYGENRKSDNVLDKQLKYMTEPELGEHLRRQLTFIKKCQTSDTIGSMLIIFQDDGITQYGATIDPHTAPQALRELADRLERRQTVTRGVRDNI